MTKEVSNSYKTGKNHVYKFRKIAAGSPLGFGRQISYWKSIYSRIEN